MLCEIPASSYKPAHLVSVSLASDVFMGFSKSANRRREEFVGFHCTCSYTLLWLISTMLLSCYTLLIKYYCVCTNFKGCIGKHICPQACGSLPQSSTRWRFSSVHLCSRLLARRSCAAEQQQKMCSRARAALLHPQVIHKLE